MAEYIDIYFLVEKRTIEVALDFMDKYAPLSVPSADDYPVALHSDNPTIIFDEPISLMRFLSAEKYIDYAIYWSNEHNQSNYFIEHIMIFYTDDNKMIFGISVDKHNCLKFDIDGVIKDINQFIKSNIYCITVEEPPPFNAMEFEDFAKARFRSIKEVM
ncbi:MAG: hypothetical protein RL757_1337 [Bacteroidota bacterium]|jgi:hypothetical protein